MGSVWLLAKPGDLALSLCTIFVFADTICAIRPVAGEA